MRSRRRRPVSLLAPIVHTENLEERTLLDASGVVAEAAGFSYFESRDELAEHLVQQAIDRHEHQFDEPAWTGWGHWFEPLPWTDGVRALSIANDATESSDTNTQVTGVDEADIIENDGEFLYFVQNGNVLIVDAGQPEQMSVVASIEVDGSPQALFLHDGTLTVISSDWQHTTQSGRSDDINLSRSLSLVGFYENRQTVVESYDVSSPAEPVLLEQTTIDGSYLDSRAIDERVHVFVNNEVALPAPRTVPLEDDTNPDEPSTDDDPSELISTASLIWQHDVDPARKYESKDSYETWIRSQVNEFINTSLPEYQSVNADGISLSGRISEFGDMASIEGHDSSEFISVVTIDPTDNQPGLTASTSVFANPAGNRYATTDHLYLTSTSWTENTLQTHIMQFAWASEDDGLQLVASGTVNGRLLNQFAMDEHDGHLRVATTTVRGGLAADDEDGLPPRGNNVYVLKAVDGRLEQVGAIEGFEEDESVFAVRFDGDRGFVVTFERIDPLFMIDLSDHANPVITGELEVPGFSTYLQRIDNNHLLAIGQIENATKVTVYDISDPTNPTLVDEDVLPPQSHSIAEYDHHAFGWYSQHNTLAIPVNNGTWYQSELLTFQVNTSLEGEEVIQQQGSVAVEGANTKRSAFIGDVLYTLTTNSVIATDMTGQNELGRISGMDDQQPQQHRVLPVFSLLENGASQWIVVDTVGSEIMPGVVENQSGEVQVLLPNQTETVDVTLDGSTLSITSEDGTQTIDLEQGVDLIVRGTKDSNSVDVDLSNAAADLLNTFQLRLHAGDDIANINGLPEGFEDTRISGGSGHDTLFVAETVVEKVSLLGGLDNDTLTGAAGDDFLSGGPGNDLLRGFKGADRLIGRAGIDKIWGHNGNDIIVGGADNDHLFGGRGNDLIRGGRGDDNIFGSNGADRLEGNHGIDRILGGLGADTFLDAVESAATEIIAGQGGKDRFVQGTATAQALIDRLFDFATNEDELIPFWSN